MTDPTDALKDARARVKQIAGRMLARKEMAEVQLKKLLSEQEKLRADLKMVQDAGRTDLESQLADLMSQFDEQITAKREEIALAEQDLKGAQEEMQELSRAEKDAERLAVRGIANAALSPDPVLMTPEHRALENVRNHAASLEAEASLGAATRPPSADLDREINDLKARQQLEALKAARGKAPAPAAAPAAPESATKEDEPPPPPEPGKKTL